MQLLTFVVDDFRSPSTPHVHMGCPLELPGPPPNTPACVSQGSGQGSLFNAMSKVKSRNSCPSGINAVPGLSSSRGSVQSKVPESSVTDWIGPPAIETTHVHLQPQFSVDLSSLPEKVECATYRRGKRQTRASAYLNFNINCGGAAGAWRVHRETLFHADITCLQEVCMCEKERAWFKRHCNMKTYACHGILGPQDDMVQSEAYHLKSMFGARGDQWHRTGRATDREVWTVRGPIAFLGDTLPINGAIRISIHQSGEAATCSRCAMF